MPFTAHDDLVRAALPLFETLLPGDALRRNQRIDRAISRDGFVNPYALLLSGAIDIDGILDDTLYSTASTTTYLQGAHGTFDLPEGIWKIVLVTMSRGTNSSGLSINYRSTLLGQALDPPVTRVGPSAGASPFFTLQRAQHVPGNQPVTFSVEFKSNSGGTSQVFDSVVLWFLMREG